MSAEIRGRLNARTGELYDFETQYGRMRADDARDEGEQLLGVSPEAFEQLADMTADERLAKLHSSTAKRQAAEQARLDRWAKSGEGRRAIRRQEKKASRRRFGVEQQTGREPERNAPCVCGSGRKYKACCKMRWDAGRGITSPAYTRLVGWSLERAA